MGKQHASETRFIILACDGRHSIIGRHGEPSEDECSQAAAVLAIHGGGWLVKMTGRYHRLREGVQLDMLRVLAPTRVSFATACALFADRRLDRCSPS